MPNRYHMPRIAMAAIATFLAVLALVLVGCSESPRVVATATNSSVQQPAPVPQDNNDVAGSTGDVSVTEQEVADYIAQYRKYVGATDDGAFATLLDQAGQTPADLRKEAIDVLLSRKLVREQAREHGIEVSGDELDRYIEDIKAGLGYASDEQGWSRTLGTSGYDDEGEYRSDIETKMLLEKLVASENPDLAATEVQMLVHANNNVEDYTGDYIVEVVFPAGSGAAASRFASQAQGKTLAAFRESAADAVGEGTAREVSETGWTCLSNVDDSIMQELAGAVPGDVVMAQADDGTYHVVYVGEMFAPAASGIVDYANMPEEIRERLASDASKQNRTNLTNNYLSDIRNGLDVQYSDMPEDAPYNVDMTLSSYGKSSTQSEEEIQNNIKDSIAAMESAGQQ